MTSENNETYESPAHIDEMHDIRDEVLASYNAVQDNYTSANARRKVERYFAEKELLDQLQDVFADDID